MSVYAVIEIEITNKEMYEKYCMKAPGIIEKHGGQYLANTDKIIPISGDWHPEKIVLLEFDSISQLENCFQSEDYQAIVHLRHGSTKGRAIAVKGF